MLINGNLKEGWVPILEFTRNITLPHTMMIIWPPSPTMIVICLFWKIKTKSRYDFNEKTLPRCSIARQLQKLKNSSKSKEKSKQTRPFNKKKKSARDPRPSQPTMRSTTKLGKKPISFKIDFEILQNYPPSCPPPYTDTENKEREKIWWKRKQISHQSRAQFPWSFQVKTVRLLISTHLAKFIFPAPKKRTTENQKKVWNNTMHTYKISSEHCQNLRCK